MDSLLKEVHDLSMTIKEKISKLLEQKAEALVKRSTAELSEIIDDGFVYINSQGKKFSKADYISLCTTGDLKFQQQEIKNLEVHDFEGFALATMILHDRFLFSNQSYEGNFRSLCAFRKVNESWLWAGAQTSEA